MRHGLQKGLNRSLDGTILEKESKDIAKEMDETKALGGKYLEYKTKLEEAIVRVENSSLSPKEKSNMLRQLRENLENVKQDYEEKVTEKMDELSEEQNQVIEQMDNLAEELKEQEENVQEVKVAADASGVELSNDNNDRIIDETAAKRESYEKMKEEVVSDLKLRQEQMQMMRRQVRADMVRNIGR